MKSGKISVDIDDVKFRFIIPKKNSNGKGNGKNKKSHQDN